MQLNAQQEMDWQTLVVVEVVEEDDNLLRLLVILADQVEAEL
jgi:hypothetical protein